LGDYFDRGPDSRNVIDRLVRNPFPSRYIALRGNHEILFEQFLRGSEIGDSWRRLGGLETLHSYGVPVGELMRGKGFEAAATALKETIPNEHLRFLSSLKPSFSIGRYFMCHAGVRPGVQLDQQSLDDLLWIRDEFLNSTIDFGKIIIHGHSPVESPRGNARVRRTLGAALSLPARSCSDNEDQRAWRHQHAWPCQAG
jgi:serine/threonine protein phosphatase 1